MKRGFNGAALCSCSTDDSFSHYSLSVHGCRLSLFYWPDVAAARPVKFLWKLEQVLWEPPLVALALCRLPHLLYSQLDIRSRNGEVEAGRNSAFLACLP